MESLERKDTIAVPDEPIKSEGMVPSPSTSDRSNSAGSPPPNCSICLGKLINTSFTDSCLHKFCFTCLLQWSKIKTECPLCKQTFKSIIHNVRSEGDYDQYDVNLQAVAATLDVAVGFPAQQWEVIRSINLSPLASPPRSFMYRTTMAPQRRFNPLLNAEAVARREQIPAHVIQVSREEARRRTHDPIDFRRQVYRQGTWALDLPDAFGRYRESSFEYYRQHPGEIHRLVPWLNREMQVLLNNNRSHIAYVINIILETITRYNIRSPDFRNVVRPYFGVHTDQFVHEFSNFARTNFDMTGYDQSVVYQPNNRGLSNEYVQRTISPSSSDLDSDSDSDVRLVEDDEPSNRRAGMNTLSVGPHMIDMPGPSTVGSALRLHTPRIIIAPLVPPVCYTISSTSESENDVEVVGYVKPRHERTPEIIDLDSESEAIIPGPSTSEANNLIEVPLVVEQEIVVPGPSSLVDPSLSRRTRYPADDASKCCMYEYFSSTTEDEVDESDSDYNPQSKSRSRRKKKSSKSSPRKARSSRKRKKSTPRKRDKSRKSAVERHREYDSEHDSEAEDAGPSTSRGTKRYNSDQSDEAKPAKKSKKSKKSAKSSKKSKKSSKPKTPRYIEYSSMSSSMSSESEAETKRKKMDAFEYSEEEEEEEQPRYAESECSERLRIDENSEHSSDEGDDDDDDDYPLRSVKSVVAAARDSHDSESEHSASTKTSRGRYRAHKKRKDGKKHRRSRS